VGVGWLVCRVVMPLCRVKNNIFLGGGGVGSNTGQCSAAHARSLPGRVRSIPPGAGVEIRLKDLLGLKVSLQETVSCKEGLKVSLSDTVTDKVQAWRSYLFNYVKRGSGRTMSSGIGLDFEPISIGIRPDPPCIKL